MIFPFLSILVLGRVFASFEKTFKFLSESLLEQSQKALELSEKSFLQLIVLDVLSHPILSKNGKENENELQTLNPENLVGMEKLVTKIEAESSLEQVMLDGFKSKRQQLSHITELRKLSALVCKNCSIFQNDNYILLKKCISIMDLGHLASPLILVRDQVLKENQGVKDSEALSAESLLEEFDRKPNYLKVVENLSEKLEKVSGGDEKNIFVQSCKIALFSLDFLIPMITESLNSIETLRNLISKPTVVEDRTIRREIQKLRILELEMELKPFKSTLTLYRSKLEALSPILPGIRLADFKKTL